MTDNSSHSWFGDEEGNIRTESEDSEKKIKRSRGRKGGRATNKNRQRRG